MDYAKWGLVSLKAIEAAVLILDSTMEENEDYNLL